MDNLPTLELQHLPQAEAKAIQCTDSFPLLLPTCCTLLHAHRQFLSRRLYSAHTEHKLFGAICHFHWLPRFQLPVWKTKSSPIPASNYFMVELHIGFIETLITSKLSLCSVKYVGYKTLFILSMQLDGWWRKGCKAQNLE